MSLAIAPGSKQVLNMLSKNGGLGDMIDAGARILESACGPCIGMGQSPSTDAVSLRTFNRNFKGRSGTVSANVYIVSPEVAAASALTGYITDPRELGEVIKVAMPEKFLINDNLIISPSENDDDIEVKRGPNIKPFPKVEKLKDNVEGKALIKLEDNITTDHIMPSNAKLLPFRSNIPYLSEFCLTPCDENFPSNAKKQGGGIIIAGSNYGQGSSREHAALAPLYLGIKAIIAKSFARIHKANLINNAIIPLVFHNANDYEDIDMMDELIIENAAEQIKKGIVIVRNITKGAAYKTLPEVTEREQDMLIHGGLINLMKTKKKGGI
jgi:aconitate hydratase